MFEIGGERHAIEAELSTKTNREIRQIVAEIEAARRLVWGEFDPSTGKPR